jgi:hypothetical protein
MTSSARPIFIVGRIPEWNRDQARIDVEEVRRRWHAFLLRHPSSDGEWDGIDDDGEVTDTVESWNQEERRKDREELMETRSDSGLVTLWTQRARKQELVHGSNAEGPTPDVRDARDRGTLKEGVENPRLNKKFNGKRTTLSEKEATWGGSDSENEPELNADDESSGGPRRCSIDGLWFPDLYALLDHQDKVHR